MLAHGTGRHHFSEEKELSPGSYLMRVRGVVEGTPDERRFIQVGHPQRQIDTGLEAEPSARTDHRNHR